MDSCVDKEINLIDMKKSWKWFFVGLATTIIFVTALFEIFKLLEKYYG